MPEQGSGVIRRYRALRRVDHQFAHSLPGPIAIFGHGGRLAIWWRSVREAISG